MLLGGIAYAQEYPNKPLRLIIGFPPGGANDILGRFIAPKIAERFGTTGSTSAQVVIENRPGANAIIGTDVVAKSAPDGYTLGLAGVTPLVITAFTYAKVPYDSINDLVGISTVVMTPQLMVVHPSLPATSLKALIALAKAQPGKMDFATAGSGGTTRMAVELFKLSAGVNVQVVTYKGAAQGITELLGGHVQGMVMDLPALVQYVKGGKLRGIVNTGERRSALLPDVPTATEQGMPTLQAVNWYAIVVPAKTPRAIIDKLHGAVTGALQAPDLKARLSNEGFEPMISASPEAYTRFHKQEFARWGKVAKGAGVKAE